MASFQGPPTPRLGVGAGFRPSVIPRFEPVFALIREVDGRFKAGKLSGISRAHQEAAAEVRLAMANRLDELANARAQRRGFPRRNSMVLTRALRDDGNARGWPNVNWVFGFQVGLAAHLNATPARPYWHRLEEGEQGAVFVGRMLRRFPGPDRLRSFVPPRFARTGRLAGGMEHSVVLVEHAIQPYQYMTSAGREEVARLMAGGMWAHYRAQGVI